MLVEGGSAGVDGVDDEGSCAEVTGACDGAGDGVEEQVGSEPGAVASPVECEPGEEEDGDRVGLASTEARGGGTVLDGAHREGVVADDDTLVGEDPGGGGAGCGGDRGGPPQPLVKDRDAAVEVGAVVTVGVE